MEEKAETVGTTVEGIKPVRLRNVLFATDFSAASERALNYALAIARRYESHLYVAHVIRPDMYQPLPPDPFVPALELSRPTAEQEMANLLISARLRGVSHEVLLEEGGIWPALSRMIKEKNIDLVVLGTHGRTGAGRILLGSVAEEIFRLAQCPVLTVGPKASDQPPVEGDFRHILYPTDFSPACESALPYALSLAQEHQARLTLLHVAQDIDGVSAKSLSESREFLIHRLEKLVPPGAELWCEPESAVGFGPPVEGILQVATARKSDLIVLGIRGDGGLLGHLLSNKAYKIVCQAPCPVLTVRG
jgi:nucleotide-binding universal stress UspA family protein